MRVFKRLLSVLATLLFDMLFHPLWTLLAAVLLVLHFLVDISIWWFIGLIIGWIAVLFVRGWFINSASRAAMTPDRPCGPRKTIIPHKGKHQ